MLRKSLLGKLLRILMLALVLSSLAVSGMAISDQGSAATEVKEAAAHLCELYFRYRIHPDGVHEIVIGVRYPFIVAAQ